MMFKDYTVEDTDFGDLSIIVTFVKYLEDGHVYFYCAQVNNLVLREKLDFIALVGNEVYNKVYSHAFDDDWW